MTARVLYRWLLVFCAACTVVITWKLWQVRETPPMLPLLALPRANVGTVLLTSLAAILILPRAGITAFIAVFGYAALIDQTRLQPQFVSFILLLVGTLPGDSSQTVGRTQLIATWGWAGVNKLLSPTFLAVSAPALLATAWPEAPSVVRVACGYLLGCSELGLAIAAAVPRTRRFACFGALVIHAGIILVLLRQSDSNAAILPWNVALGLAGFGLLAPWKQTLQASIAIARPLSRLAAASLLLLPIGFYLGLVDAYLAHNLYTANATLASIAPPTMRLLRVPFPPERRLFIQYFQSTCNEGQQLQLVEQRLRFSRHDVAPVMIPCEFHVARPHSP